VLAITLYGTFLNVASQKSRSVDPSDQEFFSTLWPVDGGTWPSRARCMARTALYQGGQRLALPHSRPMPQGRSRNSLTVRRDGSTTSAIALQHELQLPLLLGLLDNQSHNHEQMDVFHLLLG
jgi:hypothetical protein